MEAHELADVAARRVASGRPYLEFITVPDLSIGLYVLAPGQPDLQQPHTEDEVYYVVSGRGAIRVGTEDRPVAAGVEHRFHSIAEDLAILVFFAPAEYTRAAPGTDEPT